MGRQIHLSRLLTFVAREVPDLLKPAYAFGGLSMSQMVKPYVDNWLVTRQSVQDLIKSFSTFVLKTNMMAGMSGIGGDDFFKRLDIFNATRSNRGLMAIDKETEDFANVSASLSGLDKLQAQAQEHMASCSREPLVKLTGITPSGLNASSEGELECWGDRCHSYQETFFRPKLETVLNFVQLSLFGEIDPSIDFEFLPIVEETTKEKAETRQIHAQTDQILVELGAVSQQEVRSREANDPNSPHAGLDVDEMPDLPEEEAEGLMPGAEGLPGGEQPGEKPTPEHQHHQRVANLFGANPEGEGGMKAPKPFGKDIALDAEPKRKRGRSRKQSTEECPSHP
jgi:phage-related protein (TIGR01555 family)